MELKIKRYRKVAYFGVKNFENLKQNQSAEKTKIIVGLGYLPQRSTVIEETRALANSTLHPLWTF